MVNDPIADMLMRIRNASAIKQSFTHIIYSKINVAILKVLKRKKYIITYSYERDRRLLCILLNYKGWWFKKPYFLELKRLSKPGQRIYSEYKKFHKIVPMLYYNEGLLILSTSLGIIGHKKAVNLKEGGELLCYIG